MMQNQFEQNRQAQIGGMGGMGGMGMRQAPWFPMQQFGGGMPEAMPYRYGGIGYGAYNGYNGPTWGNLGSVSGQFDPFTFNGAIGGEQNWGVANAYAMDNPMAAREEKPRVATAQNLNTNYSPYESTGGA